MDGRIEEMTTVRTAPAQARRTLVTTANFAAWVTPTLSVVPVSLSPSLAPGDRFRLEAAVFGAGFDYLVEAVSDREVVLAFEGPWSGRERWSFVADGAETIVRRMYEVNDSSLAASLAWRTAGRALVAAHFKFELARFRDLAERQPGPRAEIEPRARDEQPPATPFPVDEG